MSGPRAPITPATKVAELLESWPELEPVLIAQAPAFRRLRNPVLRRTVARVATLEQAAAVGGVSVRELVAVLRRAAGLGDQADAGAASGSAPAASDPEPAWLDPARVAETIDADALLDKGEVPLSLVNARARALAPGAILRLDSSFRPAPLTDALARAGYRCFVREAQPGRFETFVTAP